MDVSGKNNPFYGKHHTDKNKKKHSERMMGEKNPNFNKKISEETKIKMRKPKSNTDKMKNKIYINNGLLNKKINKDEPIPEGWSKGRLSYKPSQSGSESNLSCFP